MASTFSKGASSFELQVQLQMPVLLPNLHGHSLILPSNQKAVLQPVYRRQLFHSGTRVKALVSAWLNLPHLRRSAACVEAPSWSAPALTFEGASG